MKMENTLPGIGNPNTKKREKRNWCSDYPTDHGGGAHGSKPLVLSPYFISNASESQPHSIGREAKVQVQVQVLPRGYYHLCNNYGMTGPSLQRKSKPKKRVVVVSPYFHNNKKGGEIASISPQKERESDEGKVRDRFNKLIDAYRRKGEDNNWVPPNSVHGLLQEKYYQDPWKVLVICMLLNKTRGGQAAQVIADLFELCPNARAATEVETEKIEKIIATLGLQKKRSMMIQRFSQEYLSDEWTHVTQLHGIGKYAADAYAIFCTGSWKDVKPDDLKLVPYWEDLWVSEKMGSSGT